MSDEPPEGDAAKSPEIIAYERGEVTAREQLRRERSEALQHQNHAMGWLMLFGVGPAALGAIAIALVAGRTDLAVVFGGIGAAIQLWRVLRDHRRIKEIELEMEDPIDGS